MARKRKTGTRRAFGPRVETAAAPRAIASAELDLVVGGRVSVSKGPDPSILRGLKSLTESVAVLGQKRAADQAGQQQMMQQVMQKMMGGR